MSIYDVAIIGAGPAGCAAALALRSSGLKVALIDRATFPRDKTCGDTLPGYTFKYVNELIPESSGAFDQLDKKRVLKSSRVYFWGKKVLTKKWSLPAVNSSRIEFDNYLFSAVQTTTKTHVAEECKVSKAIRKKDHIELISSKEEILFKCKTVLLATGANAELRDNLLHHPISKNGYGAAVSQYYSDVDISSDQNHFFLPRRLKEPGYFWIFPVSEHIMNVGYGSLSDDKSPLKQVFQGLIEDDPSIAKYFKYATPVGKIRGHKLPFPSFNWSLSDDRVLILGDAAELMDPLLGHGIDKAMKSGMLAAKIIEKAFEMGNFSHAQLKEYDELVKIEIYPELQRNSRWMKRLMPLFKTIQRF